MIISRTPYRISFFGGGTDYHTWYERHGGCVLSTTINHYCYITARYLPPFFPEKSRVVWSQIEAVKDHSDIKHASVRAALEHLNIEEGVEIHHTGDLPARSGLGSSSTFTVGILNALHALQDKMTNKHDLAKEAIHIEREVLTENVGVQDQIAASYGGFNKTTISPSGDFLVEPIIIPAVKLDKLQRHCLLFFTGVSRTASEIASEQMRLQSNGDKDSELKMMQSMVSEAIRVLQNGDIDAFGRLIHESWLVKRTLADNISPGFVDDIYNRGIKAGALGGKLLGAGGGGFILFIARPEKHGAILDELNDLLWVPFKFETSGSSIIFSDPSHYLYGNFTRRDFYHLKEKL